jgi:hypothetical protein
MCSASILTSVFGNNFAYADDTEIQFGLPIRNYNSFDTAANEAATSRLYGGIHYRSSIYNGMNQGKNIGNFIVRKLKMIK